MRKQLTVLGMATMVLIAAAPAPAPIITMEGVSAAVKLSPELRAALAPHVKALNTRLEGIVALQASARKAGADQHARLHEAMKAHHDECQKLLHEMIKQMDEEQRAAFHQYLHEQLKAAGIELPKDHGHGAHSPHGDALSAAA
jgi:hypothetical protein